MTIDKFESPRLPQSDMSFTLAALSHPMHPVGAQILKISWVDVSARGGVPVADISTVDMAHPCGLV